MRQGALCGLSHFHTLVRFSSRLLHMLLIFCSFCQGSSCPGVWHFYLIVLFPTEHAASWFITRFGILSSHVIGCPSPSMMPFPPKWERGKEGLPPKPGVEWLILEWHSLFLLRLHELWSVDHGHPVYHQVCLLGTSWARSQPHQATLNLVFQSITLHVAASPCCSFFLMLWTWSIPQRVHILCHTSGCAWGELSSPPPRRPPSIRFQWLLRICVCLIISLPLSALPLGCSVKIIFCDC